MRTDSAVDVGKSGSLIAVQRSAYFSPCRTWRYSLTRQLAPMPECDCLVPYYEGAGQHSPGCNVFTERVLTFVGLNPSTADETVDDPTIRRCMGFARAWGYHRLKMVNLYAFRATKPSDLWLADDPVGPENDHTLSLVFGGSDMIVAAWGCNARPDRLARFAETFGGWRLNALGVTKDGAPRHPLYMRADSAVYAYDLGVAA